MDISGNLKTGLFVGLLFALDLYHIVNLLKNQYIQPIGDLYTLVNLIQLAITVAIFFLVIYNKLIARLILRGSYVGGRYEGKSSHFRTDTNKFTIERFTIAQNLFK